MFLRGLISVVLLYLIFRKVDWPALRIIVASLDLRWVVLGSACTLLLIGTLALRWRVFLAQQGIQMAYRTVFALTWAGQFFNSVLPGSTGGDVIKIITVCGLVPDRKAAAASTVFVDRLSALLALALLAAIALCIYPQPLSAFPIPAVKPASTFLFLLIGTIVCTLVILLSHVLTRRSNLHGRITRTLLAARAGLSFQPMVIAAVLLAFVVHLLNFAVTFFFARALGIPITYTQILLMMPVILFIVLIPVTINGHGLREMLLIAYFTSMGIVISSQPSIHARETAVALSLVLVANDLICALPGGLLYLKLFALRRTRLTAAETVTRSQPPSDQPV